MGRRRALGWASRRPGAQAWDAGRLPGWRWACGQLRLADGYFDQSTLARIRDGYFRPGRVQQYRTTLLLPPCAPLNVHRLRASNICVPRTTRVLLVPRFYPPRPVCSASHVHRLRVSEQLRSVRGISAIALSPNKKFLAAAESMADGYMPQVGRGVGSEARAVVGVGHASGHDACRKYHRCHR